MTNIHSDKILILDFGSQYTQLIARRVREIGVYCELFPYDVDVDFIKDFNPKGIILSGGPDTVTTDDSARAPQIVFDLGVPILGICYGMQLITHILGGKVDPSPHREFGRAELMLKEFSHLFDEVKNNSICFSHIVC